VDDESVTPKYDLANSLMILPFASPLPPGQSAVLKMYFAEEVPQSIDQNYGVLAYYDNVLALAHSYPMICVYNEEGWNAEIPPQSGDVTFADAAFFIVKITAPKGLTLVTTGSDVNYSEEEQTQTLTVADCPARDFYLTASTDYKEFSKTFGDVTIHSYALNGSEDGAQMALDVASKAIAVYSNRYTPYPYTELDVAATPTLALGIEYPGMVAIASRIYNVNADYRGTPARNYMEATVAHEVGHQWFYNLVGDDQLDEPWLDESLAQFVTLQYYIDEYGERSAEGFRASLEGRWKSVEEAKIPIGLPVAQYSPEEYGAIVYGRGALFFLALKEKMGGTVFDEFMKDYTTQLAWGIATPQFMQSLAEKHCGCDLNPLFKEWVYPQ
jgi:aminopeptidase N